MISVISRHSCHSARRITQTSPKPERGNATTTRSHRSDLQPSNPAANSPVESVLKSLIIIHEIFMHTQSAPSAGQPASMLVIACTHRNYASTYSACRTGPCNTAVVVMDLFHPPLWLAGFSQPVCGSHRLLARYVYCSPLTSGQKENVCWAHLLL